MHFIKVISVRVGVCGHFHGAIYRKSVMLQSACKYKNKALYLTTSLYSELGMSVSVN